MPSTVPRRLPKEFVMALEQFQSRVEDSMSVRPSQAAILRGLAPKLEGLMIKQPELLVGRKKGRRFMEFL